jgi:hypothetical protein
MESSRSSWTKCWMWEGDFTTPEGEVYHASGRREGDTPFVPSSINEEKDVLVPGSGKISGVRNQPRRQRT